MTKTMNDILGLDEAKCREIVDIKEKYIKGELKRVKLFCSVLIPSRPRNLLSANRC